MSKNQGIRNILSDPELWALLFLNLWLLFCYSQGKIGSSTTVFIYYIQSVLIGIFHFIRLSVYPKEGNGKGWTFKPAWFFALHYGAFHFIYFFFVIILMAGMHEVPNLYFTSGIILGFIVNGVISLASSIKEDQQPGAIDTGVLFFLPYLRIIPMHIFIMLGMHSSDHPGKMSFHFTFLVFIGLKIFSDLLMHVLTNRTWRQQRPKVIGKYI